MGSAFPMGSGKAALVVGRELSTGNTVEVRLDEVEVRQAMAEPIGRIVDAARRTLAEAPPELTHDVLETGMFLMGGGAMLTGLDLLLSQECEVPVHVAESPRETVVRGAGHMLEHLERYRTSFQLERSGAAVTFSIVAFDAATATSGSPSPRSSRASARWCRGRGRGSARSRRSRRRTPTSAPTGSG